jgi:hypothetical protein
VSIAASAQRPTPQAENPLPENHEHRAVVTEVWFAATPLGLLNSSHARAFYLPPFAIKNANIPPISAPFLEALPAITISCLGSTPSSNYSALHRAVGLWYSHPDEFRKVMLNGMGCDNSWNRPGVSTCLCTSISGKGKTDVNGSGCAGMNAI